MLKFVPPKAEKLPRYASYGAGQMKTHTEIGSAKQSLRNRCGYGYWARDKGWKEGFILELVDGEWYVLFHVKEGTKDEDLPWMGELWRHKQYSNWTSPSEPSYNPENYIMEKVARPMTKDQYAEWRVAVELERRGIVD